MQTIKFYTVGCKVNQYETQSIRERFIRVGFKESQDSRPADIYLINTCTVTHKADRDSRHFILKAHQQNPKAKIIVTGCLVEKDVISLSKIKGIDFIVSKRFFPEGISNFCAHTRAFLKIQDGCDNFCSYCKVPLVRGSSRSRPLEAIIKEAGQLVKNGFKEIVLTGICLGAYGGDLNPKINLVDAIEALKQIDGLLRIRLSSIEAGDVSDELVNKMANSQKLCAHLHIPIQSGDDKILRQMHRSYTRADYINLVKTIKNKIPQIAITTDVLVGFPGESEENFQNTVKLIEEIMPLRVHIFPYSPRKGTVANSFQNQTSYGIIKKRILRLKDVAKNCAFLFQKKFLNKKMNVLIEGKVKENPDFWQGYTDNYIKVRLKSSRNLKNQFIHLRLEPFHLGGE